MAPPPAISPAAAIATTATTMATHPGALITTAPARDGVEAIHGQDRRRRLRAAAAEAAPAKGTRAPASVLRDADDDQNATQYCLVAFGISEWNRGKKEPLSPKLFICTIAKGCTVSQAPMTMILNVYICLSKPSQTCLFVR